MLVRRVQEFINALASIQEKLSKKDLELLRALQYQYSSRSEHLEAIDGLLIESNLDPDELIWIQECFAERWKNVADTEADYTFCIDGVNAVWISFAKDLAAELKTNFVSVLIPDLTNQIDPDKLSRLEQVPDVRTIFVGNDGVWHRVLGLFERLQQTKGQFCTYDQPKDLKPRALNLKELYRIRSKKGSDLGFQFKDETYSSFWNYVLRQVAPAWRRTGDCPTHLLPNLLEIIEEYYAAASAPVKDFKVFRGCVNRFVQYLATCSLEDVNHLYGVSIDLGEKGQCYLVEILLDCMKNSEDLQEKLAAVAKWLCQFDPTMTSKQKQLVPLYEPFKVGPYFGIEQLCELTSTLDLSGCEALKPQVANLLRQLKSADKINPEIIEQIRTIYALRWKIVIDTANDYTRRQDKSNLNWICLARHLASAGHIPENYYKLLIPALKHNKDLITQELLTVFPLSHFVLSDDGTQLIYLPNCVKQHKVNGTFYQCNFPEPCPLTLKELARLQFAASRFYEYFSRVVTTEADPGISLTTVAALRELVNGTLNPIGLLAGYDISSTQESTADKAYAQFLEYIADLSKTSLGQTEVDRLYRQRIVFRSKELSFAALMQSVQHKYDDEDRGCIAVYGQYLLKLVVDYDPKTPFRKEIERSDRVDMETIRHWSAKKVYREYETMDTQEVVRRVLTIYVSLMTHGFSYLPFTGISLRAWDQVNNVTDTGRDLFNLLQPAIEKGDFKQVRFIYASLIESLVKPAVAENTFITHWTRYTDTLQWLKSIEDQSIFSKEKNTCFEPEQLFTVIWSLLSQKNLKSRVLIENFLEQAMKTSLQPKNDYLKWTRINIEFNKLLQNQNLSADDRSKILDALRTQSAPVSSEQFVQANREFLMHRVASCGARESCRKKTGLFGSNPGSFKEIYTELIEKLQKAPMASTVKNMITVLQEKIKKLSDNNYQSDSMLTYLQTLSQSISSSGRSETVIVDMSVEEAVGSFQPMTLQS